MSGVYDHRRLDPLLQSRLRLAALALLAMTGSASFTELKEQMAASDGNLGAHMKKLRDAGYVEEHKSFHEDKPLTSYRITDAGRRALADYLASLSDMLGGGR